MEDPFGCGNRTCSGRFCRPCLHRVLRQSVIATSNGASSTTPSSTDDPLVLLPRGRNSARCPSCRSAYSSRSMSLDDDLRREIRDCEMTTTCPFRGCGATMRIGSLVEHERACPHVRLACRYADWGCDWIGMRKDVAEHDMTSCEFRGGLGKLTERFRQHDAYARMTMGRHSARIDAAESMIAMHSRRILEGRARNPWNVLDVLSLTYEACLFPGRSAMRGAPREARCVVCNTLLLLPSLALAFNVSRDRFV
jgi:hypothetical protein